MHPPPNEMSASLQRIYAGNEPQQFVDTPGRMPPTRRNPRLAHLDRPSAVERQCKVTFVTCQQVSASEQARVFAGELAELSSENQLAKITAATRRRAH